MFKPFLCISFILILPFFATSQKVKFELFTAADGLSSNESHHLVQDDQGFLWFLNASRIYRYDGNNFRVHPLPPSYLPGADELLTAMTSYKDSLLFIIAETHAFLLNPYNGSWKSFSFKEKEEADFEFRQISKQGANNIFIQSYRPAAKDTIRFWRFQNEQLTALSITQTGLEPAVDASEKDDDPQDFFLSYQGQLKMYDPRGRFKKNISTDHLSSKPVQILGYKRNAEKLFFLTNHGLFTLDPEGDVLQPHPANQHLSADWINDFLPLNNGDVWITGDGRRLYQYTARNGAFYSHGEDLSEIFPYISPLKEIFKDQTGILWVRTQLGLLKVTPQANLFDTYLADNISYCNGFCSFRGIVEDEEGMIYASFYSGIAKIDPNSGKLRSVMSGMIPFGLEMEDQKLVIQNGSIFDPSTGQKKIVPGYGLEEGVFVRDKDEQLWMSIGFSLKRLDKSEGDWKWETEVNFQSSSPAALHFGRKSGLIWRGAVGELGSYSISDKVLQSRRTKGMEVSISQILAIEENQEGLLWLATDVGLVKYDPDNGKILKHFTSQDGLPNDYIAGLLTEGDSCLWLGTNNGLSRFSIKEEKFVNFFKNDGLTNNEFNRVSYYKASDGRMFFGGMGGLNAFYPQEVIKNYDIRNRDAKVVLSAFERMDERADSLVLTTFFPKEPEIELHHWDRSFIFEYALTDFDNSSDVFYSFLMEGYEDNWSNPSTFNFARFSSLPPGDYIFRVKARDSRGRWHPNELKVKVKVFPPWWASWWAYLMYFILLAGFVLGIIYFLKRRWTLQNQLLLEQKEALRLKELDGFKSRLYTNLTHEFRTPLTVILGMTDQLEEEIISLTNKNQKNENLKKGFHLIRRNGENLLRLINQLLDLSKLENQSLQLHYIQADVVNYLRYLTESFRPMANSRNVALQFYSEMEKLDMDFDPDQLMQVFANLISNAVKYTPSGGEIRIRMKTQSEDLIFQVEDTGRGIPESDLPHIFNRFYQVDDSSTRSGEGTGIGLAHTQELVHLMGGSISAESEVGKGSTFRVSLPIHNMALFDAERSHIQSSKVIPVSDSLANQSVLKEEGLHLLIIEDNPDVVTYLKSCLEGRYDLDVAFNGRIGIEKALETIPDLIVCDVMMPEKDGFEVCETLKNDERTSHIPIVILTAKADQPSRLEGLRRGADAYLPKPFDKEELLIRLEKLAALRLQLQEKFSSWSAAGKAPVGDSKNIKNKPESFFDPEDAFLQKVKGVVDENLGNIDFNPGMLSHALGLSPSQLYRKMNALTGMTPALFVRSVRLHKAKELLQTTDLNVSEIAYEVGFSSPSYFSRSFSEEFGLPPNETRK